MSHYYPQMTRGDRAYRRERMIAAYLAGKGSSRTLAALFGMSDGRVRQVLREAGVARKPGRPRA